MKVMIVTSEVVDIERPRLIGEDLMASIHSSKPDRVTCLYQVNSFTFWQRTFFLTLVDEVDEDNKPIRSYYELQVDPSFADREAI